MSVSFIYQNLSFFYRIDSINRALPVLCWGCRSLPIKGEAHSKEHMYEQIKQRLKEYYRNRALPVCKECGLTSPKMEGQSTCPDCLTDDE
jgi:uncharacterized paraquat-inducible protein A